MISWGVITSLTEIELKPSLESNLEWAFTNSPNIFTPMSRGRRDSNPQVDFPHSHSDGSLVACLPLHATAPLIIYRRLCHNMTKVQTKTSEELFRKVIRSVRAKSLQKVALIWFNLFWLRSEIYWKARKRCESRGLAPEPANIIDVLADEDIMKILNCSKRTAREYRDLLRFLVIKVEEPED